MAKIYQDPWTPTKMSFEEWKGAHTELVAKLDEDQLYEAYKTSPYYDGGG